MLNFRKKVLQFLLSAGMSISNIGSMPVTAEQNSEEENYDSTFVLETDDTSSIAPDEENEEFYHWFGSA